jgi:hypothetical protein
MSALGDDEFTADLPAAPASTTYRYYIEVEANSGKVGTRPMPAPNGHWSFDVLSEINGLPAWTVIGSGKFETVFPNPAASISCIPVEARTGFNGSIALHDMMGREVQILHKGWFSPGESKVFFDASTFGAGPYVLELRKEGTPVDHQTLVIR